MPSASKVAINQYHQCARSQILAKPRAALGNVHMSLLTLRQLCVDGQGSLPAEVGEGPGRRLKAAFFPLHGPQTVVPSKGTACFLPSMRQQGDRVKIRHCLSQHFWFQSEPKQAQVLYVSQIFVLLCGPLGGPHCHLHVPHHAVLPSFSRDPSDQFSLPSPVRTPQLAEPRSKTLPPRDVGLLPKASSAAGPLPS